MFSRDLDFTRAETIASKKQRETDMLLDGRPISTLMDGWMDGWITRIKIKKTQRQNSLLKMSRGLQLHIFKLLPKFSQLGESLNGMIGLSLNTRKLCIISLV